jgi:ribosomal protein S18 acetylase RimI-like enzyme
MKNPFGIREKRCTKQDYSFCYNLTKKTLFPYISKFVKPDKKRFDNDFKKGYRQIRILMKGQRKIGLYHITKDDRERNTLYVVRVFLSPAYQGRGIGRFLMDYFETLGYRKIKLQVWENNPAFKFYKKLGYRVKQKKDHRYLMEKVLRRSNSIEYNRVR